MYSISDGPIKYTEVNEITKNTSSKNIFICRFEYMYKTFLLFLFLNNIIFSQSNLIELPPEKGVEFKLNSLSGKVFDESTNEPVEDVNIELYTWLK